MIVLVLTIRLVVLGVMEEEVLTSLVVVISSLVSPSAISSKFLASGDL